MDDAFGRNRAYELHRYSSYARLHAGLILEIVRKPSITAILLSEASPKNERKI